MPPAMTYALLVLCLALFVFATWVAARPDASRLARFRRFTFVAQIGAFVLAYLVVRPGKGDDAEAELASAVTEGRPVLLDFYSNF